jgi:hypothetical protein
MYLIDLTKFLFVHILKNLNIHLIIDPFTLSSFLEVMP